MLNRFRNLCTATIALVLVAGTAFAQKDMGSILGTVRDTSGAVVQGAKVTVTDADRGTAFETTTNVTGEYAANPLRIGRYNVTVEKQGFRKQVVGPIEVNVQARAEVNISLHVGQIAETITVTSEGPQLETETSELGQVQRKTSHDPPPQRPQFRATGTTGGGGCSRRTRIKNGNQLRLQFQRGARPAEQLPARRHRQ
jgi:hypothetical protein